MNKVWPTIGEPAATRLQTMAGRAVLQKGAQAATITTNMASALTSRLSRAEKAAKADSFREWVEHSIDFAIGKLHRFCNAPNNPPLWTALKRPSLHWELRTGLTTTSPLAAP